MEYIQLNNGIKMPSIGFGVYQIPLLMTKQCVLDALAIGYRHIDTARNYGNEREVGEALIDSGISRAEIFLTTKIYGADSYRQACQYIDEALNKLQTKYIDLMLFHWPSGNITETYRAMEDYYKAGKLKAIGLSNFFIHDFNTVISSCTIIPMVNQVEAWSPLACGKNNIFGNLILEKIAKSHRKSTAQVALRFLNQKGIAIIPKSIHKDRIKENWEIFDFELTNDEMKEIELLDCDCSLFSWYE